MAEKEFIEGTWSRKYEYVEIFRDDRSCRKRFKWREEEDLAEAYYNHLQSLDNQLKTYHEQKRAADEQKRAADELEAIRKAGYGGSNRYVALDGYVNSDLVQQILIDVLFNITGIVVATFRLYATVIENVANLRRTHFFFRVQLKNLTHDFCLSSIDFKIEIITDNFIVPKNKIRNASLFSVDFLAELDTL